VHFLESAASTRPLDVPKLLEHIMQDESGRRTFVIVDLRDDALAQKIKADLRIDAFMGVAVLVFDFLQPLQDVFLNRAFVDAVIVAVGL